MQIAEIVRRHLGWCPGHQMMRAENSGRSKPSVSSNNPAVKSPGPAGSGGSGKPWEWLYEHTQRGTLIIGSVSAAIVLMIVLSLMLGFVTVTVLVGCILVFVLSIMSTLTVSVCDDALKIRFGPIPFIRKSWPVADIMSATAVTNPWYYGYGIRWTPHGPLYNVSGSMAVEVRLISGKAFRIGTDEPDALVRAIGEACGKKR